MLQSGNLELDITVSNSLVYVCKTLFSMASDEIVRIALRFSDARDALFENLLSMSISILVSIGTDTKIS